jgi:exocyst complex component 6
MSIKPSPEPSPYITELTRYLSVTANSVLLGLPPSIKELIYFDALSHAANSILALPLANHIPAISPPAVQTLAQDVRYLSDFVDELGNPILKENLDELQQTVALMQTNQPEEFFDVGLANRKYGRVDRANGAILLEKVREGTEKLEQMQAERERFISPKQDMFGNLSSRFGINRG